MITVRISPRRAPASRNGGDLERYVRLASAYYADLRCKRLPYARALGLWRRVKSLHYALIRSAGGRAVARAKARAIALSRRRACAARLARR